MIFFGIGPPSRRSWRTCPTYYMNACQFTTENQIEFSRFFTTNTDVSQQHNIATIPPFLVFRIFRKKKRNPTSKIFRSQDILTCVSIHFKLRYFTLNQNHFSKHHPIIIQTEQSIATKPLWIQIRAPTSLLPKDRNRIELTNELKFNFSPDHSS